jgi:uncharacterized membrane protein
MVQPRAKQKEMVAFGIVALPIMYVILKLVALIYFDPRPFVVDHFIPLIPHGPDNGFPSDHTILSAAAASVIYPYNKKVSAVLWIFTLLVGISRVYTGIHHPIDIIASIIIAIITAYATYTYVLPRIKRFAWYQTIFPKACHEIFEISVAIKGIDGLLEIIGSLFLFLISPEKINSIIIHLIQHELVEDPKDIIATHLLNTMHHFSASTKLFQALYLLVHGLIKVFLVWGLLKNKLWAYPASIAFLVAFIFYQTYRYTYTHALSLILLTIFDVFIIVLTWHEYRYVLKHKVFPK